MTNEEKQLLLKDICARLPYGVKCKFFYTENKKSDYGISFLETEMSFENIEWFLSHKEDFVDMKPYLRLMSTMTEKEKEELFQLMGGGTDVKRIDFYISHHFDYRGLIEKGIAIEAPENMYKTK